MTPLQLDGHACIQCGREYGPGSTSAPQGFSDDGRHMRMRQLMKAAFVNMSDLTIVLPEAEWERVKAKHRPVMLFGCRVVLTDVPTAMVAVSAPAGPVAYVALPAATEGRNTAGCELHRLSGVHRRQLGAWRGRRQRAACRVPAAAGRDVAMSDQEVEVVNVYAGRRPPPPSVDPAGFGRLHRAVAEALLEHAAKVGQKPYRFSERYDVAVRVWHKLNPEATGSTP